LESGQRVDIILRVMNDEQFLAKPGKRIRLKDFDPAYKGEYKSAAHAESKLRENVEQLTNYQDLLYADHSYALLIILQAMDAAGKDSTINHVMSGVNPEGCEVVSFKEPSELELEHDFLWRAYKEFPRRGYIGIFNRSYYEEVLVVRVHPELLTREGLPGLKDPSEKLWEHRFQSINNVERHLDRNATVILKFFLNVSREEQKKRLLKRLDDPKKNWKFSENDLRERLHWQDFMNAYEDAINHTSTKHAPWYIIPADHKWFTQLTVSDIVVKKLKELNLHYPVLREEQRARLLGAKRELQQQK
jgi:PPK2 family polyphosphate:nucleotide phosphotransferase